MNAAAIAAELVDRFGDSNAPMSVRWAPGRVNLIGDHVDYCGGPVLPMPIQFGTTVAVRIVDSSRVRGASCNTTTVIDSPLGAEASMPAGSWGRFIHGAIAVLAGEGISIPGVDVLVSGDIPGSGLSSSASLAVALLSALTGALGRTMPPLQLALAAQRIEHEYVGVQCGLMDQAVIALAEPGAALLFDCFDHRFESIRVDDGVAVVVVDTGLTRQLVNSAYNARLNETRAGAAALGVEHAALGRVDWATFLARCTAIDSAVVLRRTRHVVSESLRVIDGAAALRAQDWATLGELFRRSHASLRDNFEVSCPQLDVLADALAQQPGCYGARMTGAGFGGSVVALVDVSSAERVMANALLPYAKRFGTTPRGFIARSVGGVRSLDG